MKYLIILFFAGLCLTSDIKIEKYTLKIEHNSKGDMKTFEGTVTLTLPDGVNTNSSVQYTQSNTIEINHCRYIAENEGKPQPFAFEKNILPQTFLYQNPLGTDFNGTCKLENGTIEFPSVRLNETVELGFTGSYSETGFRHLLGENGKLNLYVADMGKVEPSDIFPCQANGSAKVEFVDKNTMSSVTEGDAVSLRSICFVQGDISRHDIKTAISVYTTTSDQIDSKKKVFEKVSEVYKKYNLKLKALYSPLYKNLTFTSRQMASLSSKILQEKDIEDLDLAYALSQRTFEKEEKGEFLNVALPMFILKEAGYQQPIETYDEALEEDGYSHSQSLNERVSNNNEEWPKIMPRDQIIGTKGEFLTNTLNLKCKDEFKNGVKRFAEKPSGAEAFETCFQDKDHAKGFFESWGNYPGYPVIHVQLKSNETLSFMQEQFLFYGERKNEYVWHIPIKYMGEEKWLCQSEMKVNASNSNKQPYILLDKGFYRVNYDSDTWKKVIDVLKSNHTDIDKVQRALLIDNVFSLAKSIYKFNKTVPTYVTALRLSEYFKNECDILPLRAMSRSFDHLDSTLSGSLHKNFRDHAKSILKELYAKKSSTSIVEMKTLPCKYGVEKCIKDANDKFETWINATEKQIDWYDICYSVRNDEEKWIRAFTAMRYKNEDHYTSLLCTRNENFLTIVLSLMLDHDFKTAFSTALDYNLDNVNIILNVIQNLKPFIVARGTGADTLKEILYLVMPKLNVETAKTMQKVVADMDESFRNEINFACEMVQKWTKEKEKTLKEYFEGSSTGSSSRSKPVALILLVTTLLPFVNHIFNT